MARSDPSAASVFSPCPSMSILTETHAAIHVRRRPGLPLDGLCPERPAPRLRPARAAPQAGAPACGPGEPPPRRCSGRARRSRPGASPNGPNPARRWTRTSRRPWRRRCGAWVGSVSSPACRPIIIPAQAPRPPGPSSCRPSHGNADPDTPNAVWRRLVRRPPLQPGAGRARESIARREAALPAARCDGALRPASASGALRGRSASTAGSRPARARRAPLPARLLGLPCLPDA